MQRERGRVGQGEGEGRGIATRSRTQLRCRSAVGVNPGTSSSLQDAVFTAPVGRLAFVSRPSRPREGRLVEKRRYPVLDAMRRDAAGSGTRSCGAPWHSTAATQLRGVVDDDGWLSSQQQTL